MNQSKTRTNKLVKIAILGAISFVIMLFEFPLPFLVPSFIKLDFSDLPALIAAFSLGPIAGVICELLKNLLFIIIRGTQSAYVGEFANFLIGSSLCLTAGIIYRIRKTRKMALISLCVATIIMALVGCVLNYFVLLPFYENAMNFPISAIVDAAHAVNSIVTDKFTLILFAILPFNLLKGIVISIITFVVYKAISKIL